MATKLKPVDVVIVGAGWTGGIIAKELIQTGLKIVALERGRYRDTATDFQPPRIHDELKYKSHYEMVGDLSRETVTFRNTTDQTALPMRWYGSFRPGEGTGGAGIHWAGQTWRFLPYDFQIRSKTIERYGAGMIPADMTIQDWGITYDDLEPYYDKFEYTIGCSGKAGNIKGQIQAGGNPFEGPRGRDYPTPPMQTSFISAIATDACTSLGYKVFPQPSATISQPYKNPDGVQLGGCIYCGMCTLYGCEVAAKASAMTTVLPIAMKSPNFELRTNTYVQKINLDSTGKKAVSVTYIDPAGHEIEQPADLIVLSAYALWNVHLLLLSGIGKPYDPQAGTGVVGRNYAYQGSTGASLFVDDKLLNKFMGAGALGVCIDEFNGDNFDHTGLGFIGGGSIAFGTGGGGPLESQPTPPGTPRWGSAWKKAVAKYYNRSFGFGAQTDVQAYRGHYLDLDPTYKDVFGNPLLRMTFDWGPNELKQSEWLKPQMDKIAKAINPTQYAVSGLSGHYSSVPYQSTHNTGGAVMGADPQTSVVNTWLQSWDVPNVFSASAASFPQNAGYNPTDTLCALAFRAADAIVNKYLKNPGPIGG